MSTAAAKPEKAIEQAGSIDPCAESRCRLVVVKSHREALRVPRHIVRTGGNTPGWQVRFSFPSRFFSDARHGDAVASLEAAKAYLRSIYEPVKKRTQMGMRLKLSPFPGHELAAGVTYKTTKNKTCAPTLYMVVTHPRRTRANVSFKVGPVGQYQDADVRRAVELANAKRREWELELEREGLPTR